MRLRGAWVQRVPLLLGCGCAVIIVSCAVGARAISTAAVCTATCIAAAAGAVGCDRAIARAVIRASLIADAVCISVARAAV